MNEASRPAPAGASKRPIVDGEFLFTDEDFRRVSAMLHADSGIHLPDSKATLVYSRLAKRLRGLGLRSFRDYCELIAGAEGTSERQAMLAALTTNVTRFFREPHHFDHLHDHLLPELIQEARSGGRVRLWSAGCSTGQEPYSIALTVLAAFPEVANHDFRILASDIDPVVLETAKAGVYGEDAIAAIPATMRKRWLEPASRGEWRMGQDVRDLIAFRELNLNGAWPIKGKFQAIFCRNVAIYFEEPTQARIWSRFGDLMTDKARLYIGHSERVNDDERFQSDGLTVYRLKRSRS
ncbi:MAG TPA: protein-glutamate O-methyltransferase [Caulobacteraceae bacterium]|nr:protein-glutamate O-methyltransferase [Caulobacteraceae bacterium]